MNINSITHPLMRKMTWSSGIIGLGFFLAVLSGWVAADENWLAFGLLSAVVMIPILIRWPVVSAFGLYAMLVPFDSISALTGLGGATVVKLVGIVAGAILASVGLIERRLRRPPSAAIWWGLFAVWAMFTAAWAIDPSMAFRRLTSVLSLLILYVIAVSIRPSRKELYVVCALAVIGGSIAAGFGCVDSAERQQTDTAARAKLTIAGQGANPNLLGQALILPVVLAFTGCVALRSISQKAMAIGLTGLIGAGIYVSASRGAVLSVVVALALLLYRAGPRREFVLALVVLVTLAATMPGAFYQRVDALLSGEDATGSGRTEIWGVGAKALQNFGIFGAGLNNFPTVHSIYVPHGPAGEGFGAHNTFLMVWVELGIVGLVLLLIALASHFRALRRTRKEGVEGPALVALEAACIGILVFSLFGDTIWSKNFWLALTLLTWAMSAERDADEGAGDEPAFHAVTPLVEASEG